MTPELLNYVHTNYNEEELKQFFGTETHEELEIERKKFKGGMTMHNRFFRLFHLIEKSSNRVIGACGFHNWLPEHQRSEIGYHMMRDEFKQKGFMREAFKEIIDHGFNDMNLNRIEACISPKNEASLSLVRRLGFTQEGLLREHYCKNGVPEDSAIFGLLKSEYEKNQLETKK
jgi:ribosomal-protein-alanine N-acetyltransferase